MEMLKNDDFYNILKEVVEFGISRYERDYSECYENSDLVLYQKLLDDCLYIHTLIN